MSIVIKKLKCHVVSKYNSMWLITEWYIVHIPGRQLAVCNSIVSHRMANDINSWVINICFILFILLKNGMHLLQSPQA